ncbi:diacylglycerol kinase [Vibrio europaeus]|uniref:diacylglycerol kinase n=1 Tax=Vibrio europaeus TaxID=300876 RepID=UPI0023426784|nr:diacylglycerol kinase [Vibrio europaeus]MDC5847696.1 diacylglycerol kinase [Vibrio europaeus]
MKPGATGIKRIIDATGYSIKGLTAAWRYEAAFRQEVILLIIMATATFFLPVTKLEQVVMIATLFIVVLVELLNSAIEAVVDRVGSEYHELSGRAKDIGSAAVFVALSLVVVTWGLILVS